MNLIAGEKPADVYSEIAARYVIVYCSNLYQLLALGVSLPLVIMYKLFVVLSFDK